MNSYTHEFTYSFHKWIHMYMNSYIQIHDHFIYEFIWFINSYVNLWHVLAVLRGLSLTSRSRALLPVDDSEWGSGSPCQGPGLSGLVPRRRPGPRRRLGHKKTEELRERLEAPQEHGVAAVGPSRGEHLRFRCLPPPRGDSDLAAAAHLRAGPLRSRFAGAVGGWMRGRWGAVTRAGPARRCDPGRAGEALWPGQGRYGRVAGGRRPAPRDPRPRSKSGTRDPRPRATRAARPVPGIYAQPGNLSGSGF